MITLQDPCVIVSPEDIVVVENDTVVVYYRPVGNDYWLREQYDISLSEAQAMLHDLDPDATIWDALGEGKMFVEETTKTTHQLHELVMKHTHNLLPA